MRILSSFDTNMDIKLYEEYVKKFWEEKVFLVYRYKLFLIFTVRIPIILFVLCFWILFYYWSIWEFNWTILIVLFVICIFTLWLKVLKNFIDFYMDFAIVTPKEIVSYNQAWFFSRQSKSLDVHKLKTISTNKKWIIKSIFNYWFIRFLSEWDSEAWDIELNFIYDPDATKLKIKTIIDYWLKHPDNNTKNTNSQGTISSNNEKIHVEWPVNIKDNSNI